MIRIEETKNEEGKKRKKERKQCQHGFGSVRYGFTGWEVQKMISFSYFQHGFQTDCAPTSSPCFCIKLRSKLDVPGIWPFGATQKKKKEKKVMANWGSPLVLVLFTSLWFVGFSPFLYFSVSLSSFQHFPPGSGSLCICITNVPVMFSVSFLFHLCLLSTFFIGFICVAR